MKKVAIVNVFFPPQTIGGATRVVSDNIDTIVQKYSDEVEIVGFCTQADCRKEYDVEVYPYKGFRVYRVNSHFRENMDWHAKDENFYEIFKNFLEFEKPDIVHFHCVQRMTASVVEAARDVGIPYFVTAHDAWWISDYQFLTDQNDRVYPEGHIDRFDDREYPEGITPTQSIQRERYLKGLLKSASAVLHVSESFKAIYEKNGVLNNKVIKNGVSSTVEWRMKDTACTKNVVLGHIGGMSAHKGFDVFKRALELFDGEGLEAIIVDHSKEASYVAREKIGSVPVKYVGRQSQDKIVDLYTSMDVLFAPSLWPESFGLVTREANACGCWVVASDLGGIGEDIKNSSGFVVSASVNDLLFVINEISRNMKRYKQNSDCCATAHTSESQVDSLVKEVYLR